MHRHDEGMVAGDLETCPKCGSGAIRHRAFRGKNYARCRDCQLLGVEVTDEVRAARTRLEEVFSPSRYLMMRLYWLSYGAARELMGLGYPPDVIRKGPRLSEVVRRSAGLTDEYEAESRSIVVRRAIEDALAGRVPEPGR